MKCEKCEEEATFIINNLRKNETMSFCDIHFWKFCSDMAESLKQFKEAMEDIGTLLNDA